MTGPAAGVVLAIGLAGLLAGDVSAIDGAIAAAPAVDRVTWSETAWPFLRDQWGRGRAWRCEGSRCGADAKLYVRSKAGFCDCFNHVDDDEDVDRLTDFDLFGSDRVVPLGTGRRVTVAGNPARLRAFRLEGRRGTMQALAVVTAVDCEARVAILVSNPDDTPPTEAAVLAILGDQGFSRDVRVATGNKSDAVQ